MEDHNKDCPLCAATRKVFGADKYPSCAAIANEMTLDTMNVLKARAKALQDEAAAKLKSGAITQEEHDLAFENAKFSMAFAAAGLVAMMTVDGPIMSPPQMMMLVQEKLKMVITNLLLEKLGFRREAPPAPKVDDINLN